MNKSWLYVLLSLSLCFCSGKKQEAVFFPVHKYLSNKLSLQQPFGWKYKTIPLLWHDSQDTTMLLGIYNKNIECIKIKYQTGENINVYNVSTPYILGVYSASDNTAKITHVDIDSIHNSLSISYLHHKNNTQYCSHHLLFIRGRETLTIDFEGPNRRGLQDTLNIIRKSIVAF